MRILHIGGDKPPRYGMIGGYFEIEMAKFFEDKNYGKACEEINFQIFCIDPEIYDYEDLLEYFQEEKAIDVSVLVDLKVVSGYKIKGDYIDYLIKAYTIKINRFSELQIEDFDSLSFMRDFETFSGNYAISYTDRNVPITDRK